MTAGLSEDHAASRVTVSSVVAAIKRGCVAELAAGRSLLTMASENPEAFVEATPDGRRFVVELVGPDGARKLRRISEISSEKR